MSLDIQHLETMATDLRTYLLNNLDTYLTAAEVAVTGDEIELPMVDADNFVIGYMDVDRYTKTPAFFLMPEDFEYVIDDETPLGYETIVHNIELYVIVSRDIPSTLHTQAIRYAGVIKKILTENETLGNQVDLVEVNAIELGDVEGSENKKAIKVKIVISKEIEV